MRRPVRVPIWLVGAAWIGWPFVGRFLFHHWIHGGLEMRSGPGGQDTEFLVYTPLEHAAFWLLVGVVPVVLTLAGCLQILRRAPSLRATARASYSAFTRPG